MKGKKYTYQKLPSQNNKKYKTVKKTIKHDTGRTNIGKGRQNVESKQRQQKMWYPIGRTHRVEKSIRWHCQVKPSKQGSGERTNLPQF